jgi:hypothetical protein
MGSQVRNAPARSEQVELARRANHGIQVTLLWTAHTNAVAVVVRDDSTEDEFELSVMPGSSALDVFEHPYAYASRWGVDYRAA